VAEFVSSGTFTILNDLAPNEVRMRNYYSDPFMVYVPTDMVALHIDTEGRDVEVAIDLDRLVGGVWQNVKRDILTVNEANSIQGSNEIGVFRFRLGVWAGPLGAIGGFSVTILFVILSKINLG
jgi:hypothetical protein